MLDQTDLYLEFLDVVCARYGLDPDAAWHGKTPRQLACMHKMAVRGKFRDDNVILRAGGYTREEPNWRSLWGAGAGGAGGAGGDRRSAQGETKVEEQARLQLQHADQIADIKRRLRGEKRGGGGRYGLSRDVKRVLAGG